MYLQIRELPTFHHWRLANELTHDQPITIHIYVCLWLCLVNLLYNAKICSFPDLVVPHGQYTDLMSDKSKAEVCIITLHCGILALVWLFGPANVTFWTRQCDFRPWGCSLPVTPSPAANKKYIAIDQRLKGTIKINFNVTNKRRNTQTQEPRCFPFIQYI